MSIIIGTLTIDLKANTASFSQSMDKMSQLSAKTANDVKRSLDKITLAGAAMAGAVATGTVALIKGALDSAVSLSKMAQAAGTTTETLSTLSYAAGLSNVSTETLGKGLEKLSQSAFKAQNGNVQLQRTFSRMGVSVTDSNGKLKDSGVLMEQLAAKFAGMGSSAGKTALAMAVFGKGGAAMIPMLNEYGAQQAKLNEEAHQFGLVIGTSTAEVAERAHGNLERLEAIFRGIGFAVLGATLPSLEQLSEKLIQIAKDADIPDLAKSFGEKVTAAVTALGTGLEFAERHAQALKVALEALAALQVSKIAIPIIADLAGGGLAKAGAGIAKFLLGFTGLSRVMPALSSFAVWVKDAVQFVGLLASEEGIAAAATYVLGGAFAAVGGWVGIAIGAVVGLGVALYKFRAATFELAGSTYQLRDIWGASWILMGKAFSWVAGEFSRFVNWMRDTWSSLVNWFSANWIVTAFKNAFGEAFAWASKILGSLTPKFVIDALNESKNRREANASKPEAAPPPSLPKTLPPPDTSGLTKPQRDVYADTIRKLDEAVAAQKAYLAVLDGTPEEIQKVAAEEKARAVIVELNNKLIDAGKPKLTALQEATISHKVATEESLKALNDYGKELVSQQHSADLSIQQTRAMAAANLEGDEAVRRATVDNAILGLTYNRTAEQISTMAPELARLRAELTAKSNIDVVAGANKEVDQLRDELAARQLVLNATLGSIDAQRDAALASKLYGLNQQIADTTDDEARQALLAKRAALEDVTRAEWAAADAQAALSLRSPADQYKQEMDSLNHAADSLAALQGGTLTYAEQVGIAAKQQDAFNKLTDDTIQMLLKEGSALDGVRAFFLEMEKQGKSTAQTLYEAFNQAFDKLSQGLTDMITAQNRWQRRQAVNQFGTMFENLGKSMLNTTIKQGLQTGIGSVGKALGITVPGAGGKIDGSTSSSALWVRLASATGSPLGGFGSGAASSSQSTPNPLSGIFKGLASKAGPATAAATTSGVNELDNWLGVTPSAAASSASASAAQPSMWQKIFGGLLGGAKLFGFAGGGKVLGAGTGTSDSIPARLSRGEFVVNAGSTAKWLPLLHQINNGGRPMGFADGGLILPSSAYVGAGQGMDVLAAASNRISGASQSQPVRSMGGDTNHYYSINAQHAQDPQAVEMVIHKTMRQYIPGIVRASVQANQERSARMPSSAPR